MKICILIDYDNLLDTHKNAGFIDIALKALIAAELKSEEARATCDLRVYGGWYEGATLTPLAQRVDAEIQRDFPTVIPGMKADGDSLAIKTTGTIACSLIQDPGMHLIDTVRSKGAPTNLKIATPAKIGCTQDPCGLNYLHKFFKKRRCAVIGCATRLNNVIERREQKIVDTMLACDLVYAGNSGYDHMILISGDDDFLPPLRSACLQGVEVTRIHPKPFGGRNLQTSRWGNLQEKEL